MDLSPITSKEWLGGAFVGLRSVPATRESLILVIIDQLFAESSREDVALLNLIE